MSKISQIGNICNFRKVNSEYSIDSMKIRIPISDLNSFNKCLTDTHYIVDSQGDIIDTLEANRKQTIGKLSMQVKRVMHTYNRNVDCLLIGIPSKQLGDKYFDGITSSSFLDIYDQINSTA